MDLGHKDRYNTPSWKFPERRAFKRHAGFAPTRARGHSRGPYGFLETPENRIRRGSERASIGWPAQAKPEEPDQVPGWCRGLACPEPAPLGLVPRRRSATQAQGLLRLLQLAVLPARTTPHQMARRAAVGHGITQTQPETSPLVDLRGPASVVPLSTRTVSSTWNVIQTWEPDALIRHVRFCEGAASNGRPYLTGAELP